MSSVRRVYVEKKPDFAVQAKELKHEISSYLGIKDVTGVRVLIRYDVENISDEAFEKACTCVFSEPPVDFLYQETFETKEGDQSFSVEFLPGQFDQRADSAVQCVQFLKADEKPIIRSATTYVIEGGISAEEMEAIKNHCINPVDSREADAKKPETLVTNFEEPADVKIFNGFSEMKEEELKALYESLNLAMTFKDFEHIQNYFKNEEKRDPSMTEIRVLDTYWSDHCRHTTFSTELKNVVLFNTVQVPHYNYVGDSILGTHSHMGAGSITSNVKSDKTLVVVKDGEEKIETGLKKFGAMLGDYVEVGCGSVLNPGTVIGRNVNIYPLSSVRGVVKANSIYKKQGEIVEKR